MLLYDFGRAPNPRRVRIFLAEKGIEIPLEAVDLPARAARSAEFLKKNPNAGLPVLELADGTCISESMAICRYLEELHPEPALFGTSPIDKARIEMWNRRIELEIYIPTSFAFKHGNVHQKDVHEHSPPTADVMTNVVRKRFAWLNDQMSDREWIAGSEFSVADITALCTIDFAKVIKVRVSEEEHPNLFRWHKEVSSRPSAAA